MGAGKSTFQSLTEEQQVALFQHLKKSYDDKIIEFTDGLKKQDNSTLIVSSSGTDTID